MKTVGLIFPARLTQIIALTLVAIGLIFFASPAIALIGGVLFALTIGHPFAQWNPKITKWLLQICVVLLGFGMDLPAVLRLGLHGSLFAAVSITATLLLGWWLGKKLKLDGKTTALISVGTAICGGSAIAAVSSVIAATEVEIAAAIGTIFMLNAAALYIFPAIGHFFNLDQAQFGLWAGVAIHDISSVVGAGLSYGTDALTMAAAVKLSRTLWIVPITLAFALSFSSRHAVKNSADNHKTKITLPWFIVFFLLASLMRSYVPAIAVWSPHISDIARHGMVLALFLIGTSISMQSLRTMSWKTATVGIVLWIFISVSSLAATLFLKSIN